MELFKPLLTAVVGDNSLWPAGYSQIIGIVNNHWPVMNSGTTAERANAEIQQQAGADVTHIYA